MCRSARVQSSLSRFAFGLGLAALLCGCQSTMPMEVYSSFGPGVTYDNTSSTFDWSPVARKAMEGLQAEYPYLHVLVVDEVEKELTDKGYGKAAENKADFWISYDMTKRTLSDVWTYQPYTEGVLGVNLINPQDEKLIYRGAARIKIDPEASPNARKATVDEAIRRMLEKFPSKKK